MRKRGCPTKAEQRRIRRKRKKEKEEFLDSLNVTIPKNLERVLNWEQRAILKCYLARCGIQETSKGLKISRYKILDEYINLGRALGFYYLLEQKLIPEANDSHIYLNGWNDCKKEIWRLIKNESKRWKTLKGRNS